MKLTVDQKKCIGCGLCVTIAPKTFRLNGRGKSEPLTPPGDIEKVINEAIQSCPVGAIKKVKD